MKKYERLQDVPKISRAKYAVDVSWGLLEGWLHRMEEDYGLELDPPYQRGYVWTQEQKIAYVEFRLRNGMGGHHLFWNCKSWDTIHDPMQPLELVDGKQRLSAVREFMNGTLPVFGKTLPEYKDEVHSLIGFRMHVNALTTDLEIIEWYLGMNTGGSIHTTEDLAPAFAMLGKLSR